MKLRGIMRRVMKLSLILFAGTRSYNYESLLDDLVFQISTIDVEYQTYHSIKHVWNL